MAEGLARAILPTTVSVESAGLYPGEVHPWTIEVMREIGIDITSHRSKKLEAVSGESYDTIVILAEPTVEATQIIQANKRLHWFHPDPAKDPGTEEEVKTRLRRVRDEIKDRIETWAVTL